MAVETSQKTAVSALFLRPRRLFPPGARPNHGLSLPTTQGRDSIEAGAFPVWLVFHIPTVVSWRIKLSDTGMVTATFSGRQQDNLRGIFFMLLGFFVFSMADSIAKYLTADYHPTQIVWTRQLGITLGVVVLIGMKGPQILRSAASGLQIGRGLCAIVSALSFVVALRHVPLAMAVAVSFVAPFMVTMLGALLLREQVGIRRWTAIAIGFLGTLVVIRPGFDTPHPAILFVILAAFAFALRQILSRYLGNRDRTETTMAYTALPRSPCSPCLCHSLGGTTILEPCRLWPPWRLAGFGEYMVIRALEIALAVVVAPMQYAMIIFSSIWASAVWAHPRHLDLGRVRNHHRVWPVHDEARGAPIQRAAYPAHQVSRHVFADGSASIIARAIPSISSLWLHSDGHVAGVQAQCPR